MRHRPPERPGNRAQPNEPAKPAVPGIEAIKGARSLLRRFGAQVEPALYALLCDHKSSARESVDKALKGGAASATTILVPLLIGQFALAPAVATVVAAVALQAIAAAGQEKLCEELAKGRAERADPEPKPPPDPSLSPSPSPPPKPKAAVKPKTPTRKRVVKKK